MRMAKVAIVLLADTETHEALGRMANALTTATDFKEAGDESTIIFDGAGTKWVAELSKPDHQYHEVFESVKDQVAGACSYCSSAFGVKEEVEASGVPPLEEHEGHPSLQKLVSQDYQVITF
jgi:hypothetical protein